MLFLSYLASWSPHNESWSLYCPSTYTCTLMSRLVTKPTKWPLFPAKTQISMGIRRVRLESSLSAWRNTESSATHWAHCEESDQSGHQTDLSPRWAHRSDCWFCHEAAHFVASRVSTLLLGSGGGLLSLTVTLPVDHFIGFLPTRKILSLINLPISDVGRPWNGGQITMHGTFIIILAGFRIMVHAHIK